MATGVPKSDETAVTYLATRCKIDQQTCDLNR